MLCFHSLYSAPSNLREGVISTTHISAVQWPGDLFEYVHTSPRAHWPRSFAIATIMRTTVTCRLRAARCNAVYPEASSSSVYILQQNIRSVVAVSQHCPEHAGILLSQLNQLQQTGPFPHGYQPRTRECSPYNTSLVDTDLA